MIEGICQNTLNPWWTSRDERSTLASLMLALLIVLYRL